MGFSKYINIRQILPIALSLIWVTTAFLSNSNTDDLLYIGLYELDPPQETNCETRADAVINGYNDVLVVGGASKSKWLTSQETESGCHTDFVPYVHYMDNVYDAAPKVVWTKSFTDSRFDTVYDLHFPFDKDEAESVVSTAIFVVLRAKNTAADSHVILCLDKTG